MATENFTTYTEVDPNSRVTVSASTITCVGMTRDEDTYVYKDKGVNHFNGNFTHTLDALMDNNVSVGNGYPWAIADQIGVLREATSLNLLYNNSSNLFLNERYLGLITQDFTTTLTEGQRYWYTIERDESVGSFGNLTCAIYSDSLRTVLVDTLSILLSAKVDFRYIYGLSSYADVQGSRTLDLTIDNLDLGEIPISGFPFFFDGGHF